MKYITIIFFIAIAVYNLQDETANYKTIEFFGNEVYIWRFVYHFFFDLTLTFAFNELRKKAVFKFERRLYLYGVIFCGLSTAFHILTLTSDSVSEYLAMTNSVIWGTISGITLFYILIFALYDQRGR